MLNRLGTPLLLSLFFCPAGWLLAEDFRVDSKVFAKKGNQLLGSSQTFFTQEMVVDFLPNGEAMILQRGDEVAVLVDTNRRVTCRLDAEQLFRTVAAISSKAISAKQGRKSQLVKFAAAPKFKPTWDEKSGRLELLGDPIRYEVATTSPPESASSDAYRWFADWSARLNSTRIGGLPPQARLEVNARMASHGRLPTKVTLACSDSRLDKYSTHNYVWNLSAQDRERIQQLQEKIHEYHSVDLIQYRLPDFQASTSQAAPR